MTKKERAMQPWRMLGTLAMAVALLGALGTTTASAATVPGAPFAVPASSTNSFAHSGSPSTLRTHSVSPAFSACTVTAYGYTGKVICGTQELSVYAGEVGNNGGPESFVIGTDWAIWHAWPGSNGWHSLGGQAEHNTTNGVGLGDRFPFVIYTIGTDGRAWCDQWGSPWSGWFLCG